MKTFLFTNFGRILLYLDPGSGAAFFLRPGSGSGAAFFLCGSRIHGYQIDQNRRKLFIEMNENMLIWVFRETDETNCLFRKIQDSHIYLWKRFIEDVVLVL